MKHLLSSLSFLVITLSLLSGCASPEKKKSDLVFSYINVDGADDVIAFCPADEIIMVMPEEGGKVGTVDVILNDGREMVLHGNYSAMNIAGTQVETYQSNNEDMQKIFGQAVSALPKAPFTTSLYFITNTHALTPASKKAATELFTKITARQSANITLSGHTDSVGSNQSNQQLSLRRANMIKNALIQAGISSKRIKVVSYGEAKLTIKTNNNVAEQKNRRVEISVR